MNIKNSVIPKASAASLWTVCIYWILSYVTYGLAYGRTNQFQTFWACCGIPRDCPWPKKNIFVDFEIGSVFMGSPVLSAANLCTCAVSLALGVCHDPRDTSTSLLLCFKMQRMITWLKAAVFFHCACTIFSAHYSRPHNRFPICGSAVFFHFPTIPNLNRIQGIVSNVMGCS